MNLCSSNHGEICFESRNCPLCETLDERDAALKKQSEAEATVTELEKEIETLQDEIHELTKEPVVAAIEKANNP
jgi:hypothetical protein